MFAGVLTAIVTPFINGELDEESLRGLIEFQIAKGIDGIVPCGTTIPKVANAVCASL